MEQAQNTSRYAMLIGINAYREDDKPLKGCVRDVQGIKTYLESTLSHVHISIFTASPSEPGASSPLTEEPGLWPTYDNILCRLKQIEAAAKPGDLLYIHFSGHGTTIPISGDLALPLLVVTQNIGLRYLRGLELTNIICKMEGKGLTVTLVLDCCFSGSVAREDSRARYLDYDPGVDAAYPLDANIELSPEVEATLPSHRNASMRSNWLVSPDRYTVLTACGPAETAQEIILKGEHHGLLSYTLLRTFKKLNKVGGKQQHIYHHLCAKFREAQAQRRYKQNPMFYGKGGLCFFDRDNSKNHIVTIPIIKRRDGSIQLEAGQAHGICNGDRFAVYPIELESYYPTLSPNPLICTVTHVGALASGMKTTGTPSAHVETGWLATPITRLSLLQFPVQLELSLPYPKEWTNTLQEEQSIEFRDHESSSREHQCAFYLTRTSEFEYEIRDKASQHSIHVPVMSKNEEEAARYVADVVKHLAWYKLVKSLSNISLANPGHHFTNSFAIKLVDRAGKSYHPGCLREGWLYNGCLHPECVIEVQDGDWLEMVVEYTRESGDGDLYLHIYNMGTSWEIENILEGNHAVVSRARREWRERIVMTVPDEIEQNGDQLREDIIKVFLSSRSTSFASVELPELATSAHFSNPGKRRESSGSLSDEWAAFNFRIRILVKHSG